MEQKELEYYLKILVELQLYPTIKVLEESELPELEEKKKNAVKNFINNLQTEYRELPNRDEIIYQTLKKVIDNTKKKEHLEKENMER